MPTTRNLPALTSMRAFAALAVFVYHLSLHDVWLRGAPLVGIGYVGVAFFFTLSGFVLAWTYTPGRPGAFWRRRVARVYPSHVVMLLVAAAVPLVAVTDAWSVAMPNLLLIQSWWADGDVVYGMNGVSWSLACEAFFYALFPVVFVAAARSRAARWGIPAVLLGAVAVWVVLEPDARTLAFHFPPARLGEFALGVAVACEVRAGWRPRWVRLGWVLPAAAVSVAAVAVLVPITALPNVLLAVPFAGLILAAALGDMRSATRVLSHRWLVYAGEVSFGFYLVHELVLVNLQPYLGGGMVSAVVILALSAVAAAALHHLVERPMQRLIAPPRAAGAAVVDLEPASATATP